MVTATATKIDQPKAGWRFRLGMTILIVGWLVIIRHGPLINSHLNGLD